MRHSKAEAWERKLRGVFDKIDADLEAKYGHMYPLHPARPQYGSTDHPGHSGLFHIRASFSAGYGSEHGPGYVVEADIVTLTEVPDDVEEQIDEEVVELLRAELPRVFPGRTLHVSRDGHRYKIHGDLSLGGV